SLVTPGSGPARGRRSGAGRDRRGRRLAGGERDIVGEPPGRRGDPHDVLDRRLAARRRRRRLPFTAAAAYAGGAVDRSDARARRADGPARATTPLRTAGRSVHLHAAALPRAPMKIRGQPGHRATTAHVQAAYPFVAEGGLGGRGAYIGWDVYGGSFCYDPWELYGRALTSPNAVVIGIVGRANSSLVKACGLRPA